MLNSMIKNFAFLKKFSEDLRTSSCEFRLIAEQTVNEIVHKISKWWVGSTGCLGVLSAFLVLFRKTCTISKTYLSLNDSYLTPL